MGWAIFGTFVFGFVSSSKKFSFPRNRFFVFAHPCCVFVVLGNLWVDKHLGFLVSSETCFDVEPKSTLRLEFLILIQSFCSNGARLPPIEYRIASENIHFVAIKVNKNTRISHEQKSLKTDRLTCSFKIVKNIANKLSNLVYLQFNVYFPFEGNKRLF